MRYTNKDYLNYVNNQDSLFYSPNLTKGFDKQKYSINTFVNSKWQHKIDNNWESYLINVDTLPNQGWKIHITANISDAQQLLEVVAKILIPKEVSFKFLPDKYSLLMANSKYADRAESGKFITIYPESTKSFLELLDILTKATRKFEEGPYILNDKQWKDSNVYFRYGGFKPIYAKVNGSIVPVVKAPDGQWVEDIRAPYYYLPKFVKEPEKLKVENYKVKDQEFKELQAYNIKASLHFSNAGGVYLANKNNRKVVLKEGRAHAGLDSHGLGGFERIKKEYYYLNKLQDIDQVVKVYKYFEVWKNNYISEEYIEGNNLMDFLNANYPFIDKTNLYAEKCINIITKLIEIVKLIHSKGIAIGDLQPENIIVLKGGKDLKIIDFESAKSLKDKYAPGISTPGFYSRYSVNYEAADWFALFKITRYLFLPIEAGTELAPDVIANQDAYIKKKFGKRAILTLDRTKVLAAQYTNITPKSPYYNKYLRIPKIPLEVKNIKNNVHAVEKGIIRYMDFKSPSLIKGDIKQFLEPFGVFSVSNGAFGAILALLNSGRLTGDLLNKVEEWIANNKKKIEKLVKQEPLQEGLYTGYTGIAMILAKMGKEQLAENIMLQVNDLDTNDISINSGLAGIGLSTLSYFCLTDNKRYLSLSEKIADHILQIFNNSKIRESLPGGLINGWLGASLFLWKMYMIEKKGDYKKFAIDILNYVIKKRIEIKDGSAFMKDDTIGPNRLAPYLDIGSEGVPLLILEFKNDDASFALSEQMSEVLKYTLATNKTLLTYMDSLFTGFTGLIVLDEALARVDHNYKKQNLNDKLNALNIYLISTDGTDILVPGRYGYKCSMDVETGASGLLMVLNDINTTHCNSWIPLVESKKFHVFDF